ncbi:transcription termination/antitermination protein NusG [Streptomyces smyrnaeus]|uniref:transcription termination/antitermination protein NusG n=1 Tax=Streptomyces smyrnaeus TaxID=1387713 RepID=UPI0036C9EC88
MSGPSIGRGAVVTITDGPFMTLQAVITEPIGSMRAKALVELFGRGVPVDLHFSGPADRLQVAAVPDRSDIIAKYAGATPCFGVVGRIASGTNRGRHIRVDKMCDLPGGEEDPVEATGVMIRIADDVGMSVNCTNEWVEDWAGVEETFERDGLTVDWS